MRNPSRSGPSLLLLLLTLLPSAAQTAHAQSGYMFKPPTAALSFRLGAGAPNAQGDIYKFFTSQLTMDRGDFRALAYAGDLSIRVAPRVDVSVGFGYDHSSIRSEFQDWTYEDNSPIEQTTELRRVPLSANAKYYLLPRGRSLAKYAWVPNRFTPYVTAGGGLMIYKLVQDGDWVNASTLDIFSNRFESSGSGGMLNAGAGTEWWLTSNLGLSVEARYAWSSAKLERDFDFDHIDLSGFQVTTGLSVRF